MLHHELAKLRRMIEGVADAPRRKVYNLQTADWVSFSAGDGHGRWAESPMYSMADVLGFFRSGATVTVLDWHSHGTVMFDPDDSPIPPAQLFDMTADELTAYFRRGQLNQLAEQIAEMRATAGDDAARGNVGSWLLTEATNMEVRLKWLTEKYEL
jgi:hypothetical protein